MNCGLGNLNELKAWLMPEGIGDEFDAVLQTLGKAVADQLETACNRTFGRQIDATYEASGDRSLMIVPVYPIETVTSLELQPMHGDPWEDITTAMLGVRSISGMVFLNGPQGRPHSRLRVTWSGGFWWDDTEDSTGEQPEGSALLPDDLKHAWRQQCAMVWEQRERLGIPLEAPVKSQKVIGVSGLQNIEVLPEVQRVIQHYRRFSLL